MPNDLLSPADVVTYLDSPVDPADLRLIAAVDDGWAALCGHLGYDPSTYADGSWQLRAAQLVAKRAAARFYSNPLDSSNVTVSADSGSWSANSLVGPRLLSPDEIALAKPLRRGVSGMH